MPDSSKEMTSKWSNFIVLCSIHQAVCFFIKLIAENSLCVLYEEVTIHEVQVMVAIATILILARYVHTETLYIALNKQ